MIASHEEWVAWWDARLAGLETLYGKSAELVGHATIPFSVGAELGGGADVAYFRNTIPGVINVTAELVGRDDQPANRLGNYELAICHRDNDTWGVELISKLAHYTLTAVLEPGQTMDIGPSAPEGSRITAFLFQDFGSFSVKGRNAGVLLCLGITQDELAACREGREDEVIAALKAGGIYPYTDLGRQSVLAADGETDDSDDSDDGDDADDDIDEEQWCAERLEEISAYLALQGLQHGGVADWPAWLVAPFVSIWAIGSLAQPGVPGWWAICGDLPTDYISAGVDAREPRGAVRLIGKRWLEAAACMQRGEASTGFRIGKPEDWPELAPLLTSRAELLLEWAEDDDCWEDQAAPG